MFNFTNYLSSLTAHNSLAVTHNFTFGTCSSISLLQDAVSKLTKSSAFLIACDVNSGGTTKINGGWQQRRIFTFFILKKYIFGNEEDREKQLNTCREIRRQFLSKFLHDMSSNAPDVDVQIKSSHIDFNMDDVRSNEYPDMMLDNCCGLNVSIEVSEPINLAYNESEWIQPEPKPERK